MIDSTDQNTTEMFCCIFTEHLVKLSFSCVSPEPRFQANS